jgi:hypothetical protein
VRKNNSIIVAGENPGVPIRQPVSDLLNETEAAQFLGVKSRTLRLWRARKSLPHIKISTRVVRYRVNDLNTWTDSFRTVIS